MSCSRRNWPAEAGEPGRVRPHVVWPGANQLDKTCRLVRKQGARRFLKPGQVARDSRHEVVGALVRLAPPVPTRMVPPRLLDQFAQRDRGARRTSAPTT